MADGWQPGSDKLDENESNWTRELCVGTEVALVRGQNETRAVLERENETCAVLKREKHKVWKARVMSILARTISFHFKMWPWMELVDRQAVLVHATPVDEQEGLLHSLPASFACMAKGEV